MLLHELTRLYVCTPHVVVVSCHSFMQVWEQVNINNARRISNGDRHEREEIHRNGPLMFERDMQFAIINYAHTILTQSLCQD